MPKPKQGWLQCVITDGCFSDERTATYDGDWSEWVPAINTASWNGNDYLRVRWFPRPGDLAQVAFDTTMGFAAVKMVRREDIVTRPKGGAKRRA